jgi:hypothetical protein
VIRNVCIHVSNEQPLLADLYDVPTAADAGLLCTNVRMMDGKRPVFIDSIEASFFFPYHVIRFIEIPVGALDDHVPAPAAGRGSAGRGGKGGAARGNGHSTAAPGPAEQRLPVPVVEAGEDADADGDLELEIDEGFLQRIRDI